MTTTEPPSDIAPTVVLLHGLACTGALCWAATFPDLSKVAGVVTFDQRWHGRGIASDDFSLESCADDIAEVLDQLGIQQAIVAGYSLGGAIAQEFWHRHPERVRGLVLCSTARNYRGGMGERLFFPVYSQALKPLKGYSAGKVAARLASAQAASASAPEPTTSMDWVRNEARASTPWAYPHVIDALGRFNSAPWIVDVDVPTAVVITDRDRAIPTRRQLGLAAAIPGATVHHAPGGHSSLIFDSANWLPRFLDAVADVHARNPSQPTPKEKFA